MDDEEEGKKKEKKKAPPKPKEKPAETEDEKKSKSRKAIRSKPVAPEEPSSQPEPEDSGSQLETSATKNAKRTIDSLYEINPTVTAQVNTVPTLTVTLDSTLEISGSSASNEGLISPAQTATTSNTLQVITNNNNNNTSNSFHNSSNSSLSPAGKSHDSADANDSLSKKIKLSPDTLSEAAGRRRHRLVSYKEPSLNCKMRRDKENKVIIKAPK